MASDGSPSFAFTTPEAQRERVDRLNSDDESEDWHFRNGPSPIAPRFADEEQEESKQPGFTHDFAHSHFRRRNRLETRLEELQKDVASLTLKLRAGSNRSTSLDASSFLVSTTPADKSVDEMRVKNIRTPTERKRRLNSKEQVSTSGRLGNQSSTVRTLRELHKVTTERDQLKFELDRTKRALAVAEKKCQDALRGKKAYEKLKAHCDSLQESLDLSERIRVRQKKLLQQLQVQQQQRSTRPEKDDTRMRGLKSSTDQTRVAATKKRPTYAKSTAQRGSTRCRSATTPSKQTQQESSVQGYGHTGYDILDSLVTSSHQLDEDEEKIEDAGLATHEQSPSEPTAAASRSRTPRSVAKPTTPTVNRYRSDFDSLLQVNDAPQFSTRRPSRITTTHSARRPSPAQVQQRDAMRQAAKWAHRRGTPVDVSVSTTRLMKRSPTARPKNSFLAPTQASLRRVHEFPRRDYGRPPFVV